MSPSRSRIGILGAFLAAGPRFGMAWYRLGFDEKEQEQVVLETHRARQTKTRTRSLLVPPLRPATGYDVCKKRSKQSESIANTHKNHNVNHPIVPTAPTGYLSSNITVGPSTPLRGHKLREGVLATCMGHGWEGGGVDGTPRPAPRRSARRRRTRRG